MASSIANLNVKLTAGIGGFASGMSKAGKHLSGFGSGIAGSTARIAGWAGALTAAATGGGMAVLIKSQMKAIDEIAKFSDATGIQTEKLAGLQHGASLAGVSADAMTKSLGKMQRQLGQAKLTGGETANVIQTLGLDLDQLANLPADEAMGAIADKLSTMTNAAERAALVTALFGRSGLDLLPMLMQGSKGIARAQAEAEKLGLTFSRVDAAKVEMANDAMTRAGSVFTGLGRSAAIELAPFIESLASKFTDTATSGTGMGDKVVNAFEGIVGAVATATDYLSLMRAGLKVLQGGVAALAAGGMLVLDKLLTAIAAVFNRIVSMGNSVRKLSNEMLGTDFEMVGEIENTGMAEEMRKGFVEEARKLSEEANSAFDDFTAGKNSTAATAFFADLRAGAEANAQAIADAAEKMSGGLFSDDDTDEAMKNAEKVTGALADLQKQVDQAGMTDSQKKLADLSALSADPEQFAQAEKLLATIEKQSATQTLADKAKSIVDELKTPLEKYNEELAELQEMLDAGLLTQGEFDAASKLAAGKMGADEPQGPGAIIEASSAAADRFAFEQSRGLQSMGKDEIAKKQLKTQENSETLLAEVARNTRNGTKGAETVIVEDF